MQQLLAQVDPGRICLVDEAGGQNFTYASLAARMRLVGRRFEEAGLKPGDRVAVFLENSADLAVVLLTLFEGAGVILPLNPRLHGTRLDQLLGFCDARFLVTSARFAQVRNEGLTYPRLTVQTLLIEDLLAPGPEPAPAPPETGGEETGLQFIFFTSGTTGNPKGVMHSRAAMRSHVRNLVRTLGLEPGAAFRIFLPLFSGHGLIPGFLVPFFSGCTVHVGRFDAFAVPDFWTYTAAQNIRYFTSVPSVLRLLKNHAPKPDRRALAGLARIFCASAPLPQDLYDWCHQALGLRISNCYGITETGAWNCVRVEDPPPGSATCVGRPVDCRISIRNEAGEEVEPERTGEIWIRGENLFLGYLKNEDETRRVYRDGWLHTGDVGLVDAQGRLHLNDRIKNIVIKNGTNIYPVEVDGAFLEDPAVLESASFGMPDEQVGERLVTALVLREGAITDRADLLAHACAKLPPLLVPDDLFFLSELPRNATGKVLVEELRTRYRSRPPRA